MKFRQHFQIGQAIYEKLNTEQEHKINRIAYLFGNVAPDFNCVYPAHRVTTTKRAYKRHLKRIEKTKSKIIRSFTLGMITHYTCDYFCYAHNNESLGARHKKYETGLFRHFTSKEKGSDIQKEVFDLWKKMDASGEEYETVFEKVEALNKEYRAKHNVNRDTGWECRNDQMVVDTEYSMFIAFKVVSELLCGDSIVLKNLDFSKRVCIKEKLV